MQWRAHKRFGGHVLHVDERVAGPDSPSDQHDDDVLPVEGGVSRPAELVTVCTDSVVGVLLSFGAAPAGVVAVVPKPTEARARKAVGGGHGASAFSFVVDFV